MKTIAAASVMAMSLAVLAGCGQATPTTSQPGAGTPTGTSSPQTSSAIASSTTSAASTSASPTKVATSTKTAAATVAAPNPTKASTKKQVSPKFPLSTGDSHLYVHDITFSKQSWGERVTVHFAGDGVPAYQVGYVRAVDPGPNDEGPSTISGAKILQIRLEGLRLPDKTGDLLKVDAPDSGKLIQGTSFMPFWEGQSLLHLGLNHKHKFQVHTTKTNPTTLIVDLVDTKTAAPTKTSSDPSLDSSADTTTKKSKSFPNPLSPAATHVESISRKTQPWGEQIRLTFAGQGRPAYKVGYVDKVLGGPAEENDPKFTSKNLLLVQIEGLTLPDDVGQLDNAKAPKPQGLIKESHFAPFWEGRATLHLGLTDKNKFEVKSPTDSPQTLLVNIYKKN